MQVVYDIESFPNLFLCGIKPLDQPAVFYEISERRNDIAPLQADLRKLTMMVGFNNIAYDYPVLHYVLLMASRGPVTATTAYHKTQRIIDGQKSDRFAEQVHYKDILVPQMDLFLIHHFDNPARRTSLKALQFAMKMSSIEESPLEFGRDVPIDKIPEVIEYNLHDLEATERFFKVSKDKIEFRKALGKEYTNCNNTKIGKKYLIKSLESRVRGSCYYSDGSPRQTQRASICLGDITFPYIKFQHPNLNSAFDEIRNTTITKTKEAFARPIVADLDGFLLKFGTGGLHGSINNKIVMSDVDHVILDMDVASFYPSVAIVNRLHPEHLGVNFCAVYEDLKRQRLSHPKKSPISEMLKLGLNGAYGDSNSPHSPFFDPNFTMGITVNGQFLLAMLVEQLLRVTNLRLIQVNTDGVTVKFARRQRHIVDEICKWWQDGSKLTLEYSEYDKMWIRDVNNYLVKKTSGAMKRIGAYDYVALDWNKDHGNLIIPAAAEGELDMGCPPADYIDASLSDPGAIFNFLALAKAPRGSRLELGDGTILPRNNRYYVSTDGQPLVKIMPPLDSGKPERRLSVQAGRRVTICNRIDRDFTFKNVDVEYYVKKVRKLTGDLEIYD